MVIIIVKYLKVMRKHNDVYFLKMKKLKFKEV